MDTRLLFRLLVSAPGPPEFVQLNRRDDEQADRQGDQPELQTNWLR